MSEAPALETFQTRDALSDAAAGALADALRAALAHDGRASLIVTGGSSPGPVYDRLADADLGWDRVTVTLSDDRFVPETSDLSNARLVRERLLQHEASAARFVPLVHGGATPDADAAAAEPEVEALAPFAAVLLGVGEDGHIASLFPGAPGVAEALDPVGPRGVVGVPEARLAPFVPRISLTARLLFRTSLVVVLITGEAKRALVERVRAEPAYDPPVAAVFRQSLAPVRVLWAP